MRRVNSWRRASHPLLFFRITRQWAQENNCTDALIKVRVLARTLTERYSEYMANTYKEGHVRK